MKADRKRTVGVVAAAAAAALGVWAVARMLGIELTVKNIPNTSQVGAVDMVVAALVAGVAAWGAQALLARRHAARWWPSVGSIALAISLVGPSWFADGAAGVALTCAHFAVGIVLIAGLSRPVLHAQCVPYG